MLAIGESDRETGKLIRRVTLLQPAELPYPVRVEEYIKRQANGEETVVDQTEMVADRFIVKPEDPHDNEWVRRFESEGAMVKRISATGLYRVELAEYDFDTIPETLRALQDPSIRYAEPDYIVHLMAEPDDPDYLNGQLWGLHNTGQDEGVEDADIDAPEGWDIRTDAGDIIIGMVDTGIRYTHEDIAANMWINPGEDGLDALGNSKRDNGIDDDGNGYVDDVHGINALEGSGNPYDDHGHGSHTAGTAAAVGNNGTGVTGVAWKAQIMALKFLGSGSGSSSDAVICIDYAIQKGARLTSNSWGGERLSKGVEEIISAANDAGQLFIAAAGNNAWDNDISDTLPADYPLENIISVAAINRLGELASFSNYGAGSVHLAAPGQKILSLENTGDTAYQDLSGTSMATPMVAGIAALVMAEFPGEDHMAAKNRILAGAQRFAALSGKSLTGAVANLHGALTRTSPAPFNDDFANALEILEDPQVLHANNRHATVEPGEPVPAGFGKNTIWFRLEAKVAGKTIANTAGSSFNTTLAVYAGDTMEELFLVGGNDDYEGSEFSRVEFQAAEGATYYIAVSGKANRSGFVKLTVSGPPVEDFLRDALPVPRFPFTYTSDNTNAAREENEPEHAGQPGGGSLWLKLRLADHGLASQEIVLSSRNSEFDTLLAVYQSEPEQVSFASLVPVASNDDAPYGDTFSEVSFFADAQTTYYIATDGKQNARGIVRLVGRNKSGNDDFEDAFILAGESVNLAIPALEFRWATREADEPNHDNAGGGTSLWYRWSPPVLGDYEIRTNATTALGIYSGPDLASLITEATDQSNGTTNSLAVLAGADPAKTYRIAVDSRAEGIQLRDIEFSIRPFTTHPNDTVAKAHTWAGMPTSEIPLEWSTDNGDASLEPGEPGSAPFQSVWLKWTVPTSGTFQLETDNSSTETHLQVYTGPADATSFAQLQPFSWLNVYRMTYDLWANYAFTEGTTYYIRVGSLFESDAASFTVRLSPFSPPVNDNFADAEVINGFFAARKVRNFGATRSGFEPYHSTDNFYFNNSDQFAKD
ncbi:MAG: S8 family peptidase, partial [Oceanipulchritudo sp.]